MTRPAATSDELVPIAEACTRLKVGESTLYRGLADGKVPGGRQLGNRWIIARAVFERWLVDGIEPAIPSSPTCPRGRSFRDACRDDPRAARPRCSGCGHLPPHRAGRSRRHLSERVRPDSGPLAPVSAVALRGVDGGGRRERGAHLARMFFPLPGGLLGWTAGASVRSSHRPRVVGTAMGTPDGRGPRCSAACRVPRTADRRSLRRCAGPGHGTVRDRSVWQRASAERLGPRSRFPGEPAAWRLHAQTQREGRSSCVRSCNGDKAASP